MTKTQEIREELISVFSGKKIKILDSIIPTSSLFSTESIIWAEFSHYIFFDFSRIICCIPHMDW